ncbi:M20 metallopeptidase family protein [Intestinibacter sp.]|uniref:M20 metallopeptidase family protein n=1 Tax=Intestinibacter sp. TaxID=1965304 RepID=UPI002A918688|nr:amidohydrolase [Intestinibacter sp.]MDY5213428.1 amidohydrolase [Intestinibacter sp.]
MLKNKVEELVDKYLDEVISIRRYLHQNPELSLKEFKTSEFVAKELNKLGLPVQRGIKNNGVVSNLNIGKGEKTLMLRADMDALPIQEETNFEFKSNNPGVMHACGHDVHTAILLGVIKILNEIKDEINGNVKFVFQPAEENNPTGGAPLMIKEGVLEKPHVDNAVAIHVWDYPIGKIALKPNAMMSESNRIFINIKGQASHASKPHEGHDAIVCAAYLITQLQTIVSRAIDPSDVVVLTLSKINGGVRYNVLPGEVSIEGTVRCSSVEACEILPDKIEEFVKDVCKIHGCDYEYKFSHGYPVTMNDPKLTRLVKKSIIDSMGEDSLVEMDNPDTGGEDFSFFAKEVPSCFMLLGCKSEKNEDTCILHNSKFNCDEDCIKIGIKAIVNIVIDYFK